MTLRDALLLVRDKYLEEQNGVAEGPTADKYNQACEKYPATMTVAHHYWAKEVMSSSA